MNALVITYHDTDAGCRRTLVQLDPAEGNAAFYQGARARVGDTKLVGLLGARQRAGDGTLGLRRDWLLRAGGIETVTMESIDLEQARPAVIGGKL